MKKILVFCCLFCISFPLIAAVDEFKNEYKTTIVEFNLLETGYTFVEIGFKEIDENPKKQVSITEFVDLHAESEPFKVYWKIVTATAFDLYLCGSGALSSGSNSRELDWQVDSADEQSITYTYFSGINAGSGAYEEGGLLHNHVSNNFNDNGEKIIKVVTDDFADVPSGEYKSANLIVKIDSK